MSDATLPPRGAGMDARRCKPLPRGPKGLPFLGNLLDFAKDQLGFFEGLARDYGDVVPIGFGGWPCIYLGDMDGIEEVLVGNPKGFIKNRLNFRHVSKLFGKGLLTSDGQFWQGQRRLAAPAFAARRIRAYDADMVEETLRMLDGWHAGDVMDVHPRMMALALRVVVRTIFGSDIGPHIEAMGEALDELTFAVEGRFKRPFLVPDSVPLPANLRYNRAIRVIERVIAGMIAERRRNGIEGRDDLLSRLMSARDEEGRALPDVQLRDEIMTLLLAGHETTALALSWTIYLLGRNPEVARKASGEVRREIGGRPATADDAGRLNLVEAAVLESMRLYPPAWIIGREAVESCEIAGYRVPAGTTVFISPWVLHRDPRHFAEPGEFRPQRWSDPKSLNLSRFAYMPFGGGPRICIGHNFAMMEAVLILATILQRFTFESQPGHEPRPFPSITLRPAGGVWVRLRAG